MTGDRSDAVVLQYTPAVGPRRKLVFEPRGGSGWTREEYEHDGSEGWRAVGCEQVESLSVETPDDHDAREFGVEPVVHP